MSLVINRVSLAAQTTIIFISALTIIAEISEPLKSTLTSLSGHHWLSKSLLSLLFFGVTLICLKISGYSKKQQVFSISVTFVLCSLVLFVYYSLHSLLS